ncbi:MAG: D-alanyl-D-alanine carboxypeptidase, partial [Paludibacteraceae bacterium]|nr:D-alanyl-D-alanine carboxypeptidase [Paludibacteraceae bacterium]
MSLISSILLAISILTENQMTDQANISVYIEDAAQQTVVEEYRAENVVPPASVMKLLTTAAMLELYGPSFRFTTFLEHTGSISDGVLHGDLIIRGEGDPSLGDLKKGQQFLYQWIRVLSKAGIKQIDGDIIADMSLFDAEAQNPSWLMEDAGNYYAPGVFAVNYMSNTLNIVLK